MTEEPKLEFSEYWIVALSSNPDYDRNTPQHKDLMEQHFAFIDDHISKGNLFIAIPMSPSGGLYIFDGSIDEEKMKSFLSEEGSIKGGVFLSDLKKGYVPAHHLIFTLEERKRIDEFHENRKKMQANQ